MASTTAPSKRTHPTPAAKTPAAVHLVDVPGHWQHQLRANDIAHTQTTERTRTRGRRLGLVVVMFSTITGTALFATLSDAPSERTRAVAGAVALVAAVLAGLQTFLGFDQMSADHHKAAARYAALRHELDEAKKLGGMTEARMKDFRARWDALRDASPTLPDGAYRRAEQWMATHPVKK